MPGRVLKSLLLLLMLCVTVQAQPLPGVNPSDIDHVFPPGTKFLTRNLLDNQTPGYWNHCALHVGGGWIVESQVGYGVINSRYEEFSRRYPQGAWYYPPSIEQGRREAAVAQTFVGRPYRRASSLAPLLVPPIVPTLLHGTPDGMNCTSVIKDAGEAVIGRPLIGLRIPDNIGAFPQIASNRYPQ